MLFCNDIKWEASSDKCNSFTPLKCFRYLFGTNKIGSKYPLKNVSLNLIGSAVHGTSKASISKIINF